METTYKIKASTIKAAFNTIAAKLVTTAEKIQMLINLAQKLQKNPYTPEKLWSAVGLYERAEEMCNEEYPLLKARIKVGLASVLQVIPEQSVELLLQAKAAYLESLPILQKLGSHIEVAEVQMNLGIVLQSLAPYNLARITDSIQAYQQALRVFTANEFPQKYAILYNNIAIAYLSIAENPEEKNIFEKLALQTFEEILQRINVLDYPQEYAMLQNNLGNVLQNLDNNHPIENSLRALAAYDQALIVRNSLDTPLEYASTIVNKANALVNLPDDPQKPELGNQHNLAKANSYYQESLTIFTHHHQIEQVQNITKFMQNLEVKRNQKLAVTCEI